MPYNLHFYDIRVEIVYKNIGVGIYVLHSIVYLWELLPVMKKFENSCNILGIQKINYLKDVDKYL